MKTSGTCLRVVLALWSMLLLSGLTFPQEDSAAGSIQVLTIDGPIGPAISEHIQQSIQAAETAGVYLLVIQMDTPGGLDLAMRQIIQAILDSDVPVATYVFPQGARAASAGTYILYASHIAAMAPATNLGAATPVQIGMPSLPGAEDSEPASPTTMENKMMNDATAYIRSLAERNNRNAFWAETAVTVSASLSAAEALDKNVIDIVASDLDNLLAQLEGRQVQVKDKLITLNPANKNVQYVEMDWHTRFLMVITNPSLILIFGMIGIYGLVIEFNSPGFGFGGVVGLICLLLAGYGMQLLPLNYAGLGLIGLGLLLMMAEAFVPSFGILGIGGTIAFMVGGVMLVDTEVDVFRVSIPLLLAVAIFSALLLAFTLRMFMKVKHSAAVSGIRTLIGLSGESVNDFAAEGMVKIQGEFWQAKTDTPLQKGDHVKVRDIDGLHLLVTKT